jgi:putative FmdB family regulatory protein
MPLYDAFCKKCKVTWEHWVASVRLLPSNPPICPTCGKKGKRLLGSGAKYKFKSGDFFEPYIEEDLGPEPVLIKSKEHLFKECRERGLGCKKMPERLK